MKNKGFVLPIVLFVISMLVLVGFYLVEGITTEYRISASANAGSKCFFIAEGGANEAIFKIKNDSDTRDKFITSTDGETIFSRSEGLNDNSSYEVKIKNSAPGVATIVSTGYYQYGPGKKAKRSIKMNIAKATLPPPYNSDASLFTAGGQASSNEDIDFWAATVNLHDSSLASNRNINLKFGANVQVDKDVRTVNQINFWHNSTLTQGGLRLTGVAPTPMPMIDFNSDDPHSYKNLAIAQNQFYTQQEFKNLQSGNLTLNGYVYVEGQIDIISGQTLTMNGVLVAEGSINIGNQNSLGLLTVNRVGSSPAGILTMSNVNINRFGKLSDHGLIYAGNKVDISAGDPITINGGVLSRNIFINSRQVDVYLDLDLINTTLEPSTSDTPVIILNHWEEEY